MAARYNWETIRAEYEAGATMGELSRKHGVDKAAISRKAKKEAWLTDLSEVVNRRAEAKVNGLVNTVDPKKKAEAVDRAADAKASVIMRHKKEWDDQEALAREAVEKRDFDLAKLAKITAETIKIRQEGERKAWGIREALEDTAKSVEATISIDLSKASLEQISAMVDAAWANNGENSVESR